METLRHEELDVVEKLRKELETDQPMLVGCVRRNNWDHRDKIQIPWSYIRGNALCSVLGYKMPVVYPLGAFHVFVRQNYENRLDVLQFRAGQWKSWWEHDCNLLMQVLKEYSLGDTLAGCYLLHEFDNQLRFRYYVAPLATDELKAALQAYSQGLEERTPPRIKKDSHRGRVVCRRCPHRAECDALDLETGDTDDWIRGPKSE